MVKMIAGVVVMAVAMSPALAAAAPVWSPPITLRTQATQPHVATNPAGVAVAAWQRRSSPSASVIETSTFRPGQGWSQVQVLSTGGSVASSPHVAVSASGAAIVVWQRQPTGASPLVEYATRTAFGQPWSSGELDPGRFAIAPRAAMDANSNALVAWEVAVPGGARTARGRTLRAGVWSAPQDLAQGLSTRRPQVAVAATGHAVAVAEAGDGATFFTARTDLSDNSGWFFRLVPPLGAAVPEFHSAPQVAVADSGQALLVWRARQGSVFRVYAAHQEPGQQSWSDLRQVFASTGGVPLSAPSLTLHADGSAWVKAVRGSGGSAVTRTRSVRFPFPLPGFFPDRAPTVGPIASHAVRMETASLSSATTVSPGGRSAVIYRGRVGSVPVIQVGYPGSTGAGSRWIYGVTLSDHTVFARENPALSLGDSGRGAAVWSSTVQGVNRVQASTLINSPRSCFGRDAMAVGADFANRIVGTPANDVIVTGAGNDIVWGNQGDDRICLGPGDDEASGGSGNDRIRGGAGDDRIIGGPGNDFILGENGDDLLYGGAGNDTIDGGPGNDRLWGDGGNDTLRGGPGNDILWGGPGNDSLFGDDGNDSLFGGSGFDRGDGGLPGTNTCSQIQIAANC